MMRGNVKMNRIMFCNQRCVVWVM